MGGVYSRRALLRRIVVGASGLTLTALLAACGQPRPTAEQPVGARAAQTPGGTSPPPAPTPIGDTTPLPTVERTIVLPSAVLPPNTGPQMKPTLPPILTPTIYPTGRPEDPYCFGSYGSRPAPDTARSVQNSAAVLIGIVQQLQTPRWTTPDGNRPANPHAGPPYFHIYTPVLIALESPIRGTPSSQLKLFVPVGTIGQDCARSSDFRRAVKAGERTVFFLRPTLSAALVGADFWEIEERYVIAADGTVNNGYRNLTLQQLLDEINAASPSTQPTPQATTLP